MLLFVLGHELQIYRALVVSWAISFSFLAFFILFCLCLFKLQTEDDWDCRKLLSGEQSCLTQRVSGGQQFVKQKYVFQFIITFTGDAPWGSFDFVFVCWGSFFAGFSFYRQSQIHSIYLGDEQLGSSSSVMGCMHSGWNDVTGSFLLQPARPFVPNVRENSWGDAFADYHLVSKTRKNKRKFLLTRECCFCRAGRRLLLLLL
jgi:hypothetical protein